MKSIYLPTRSQATHACTPDKTDPPTKASPEEIVPVLTKHLDHGHAAALLRDFYDQLSRERFAKLSRQVIGLLRAIT